ncbi:MAG: transporter substrate-binding domain-containing protein [Hydrogenophaga sp.]|nr:transporter substrate-binding domain-containing protein [Hydrogenophaga sp.]
MTPRTLVAAFLALNGAWAQAQTTAPAAAPLSPLTVCVSEDNAPYSFVRKGQVGGFDMALAGAVARELGRELRLVPFEPEVEKESMLTHEVNALLSAGVCDLASGFPLLKSDLGAPTRARFKTADHPGAARKRDRPFVELGTLIHSQPYQGTALVVVQRSGLPPAQGLGGLKGRKIAAVAGTLEGTLIAMHGGGALRDSMVTMGQRDDLWAAMKDGRIDAMLLPTAAVDAQRQRGAGAAAADIQLGKPRPLGINLGFVALAPQAGLIAVVDRVIARSLASGELQRWASEAGLSFVPATAPAVASTLDLATLLAD